MAAGEGLQVRPGCPNLIERIESGLLSYGNDMTLANNPIEAGLDRFFKLGKPADYLGRVALEKIAAEGVSSRLVRLTIAGAPLANPRTVYAICDETGVETGAVTSAVYSPRLEINVAFAYVPVAAAEPGNRLSVMTPDGVREATVTDEHWQTP